MKTHPATNATHPLDNFFYPKSLLIIGVSVKRINLGKIILINNVNIGFKGTIFAVGSEAGEVQGVTVYTSVAEVPETPDVAIIITPAPTIPDIMVQCGEKGITHIVIESGGFTEYSQDNKSLEREVLDIARRYGMRIIGPNCIGTINVEHNLIMPFALVQGGIPAGSLSIVSQSGGVGDTYMRIANENHIFFNKFIAVGNKLDLDEVDFMEYLIQDTTTTSIFMYLEGINRGRAFFDTAMKSDKPIIVQKSNRSPMSSRIAQSHTAALSADDEVVGSMLHQAAVVRVKSEDELIIAAKALQLPMMKGRRLAVLSRSGGHAVITVDACAKYGFELVEFPESFLEKIRTLYNTRIIAHQNPLDLGEIFDYTIFTKILEATLELDNIDGIVFNHVYQSSYEAQMSRTFLDGVHQMVKRSGKPVAVTLISDGDEILDIQKNHPFPTFNNPLQAITALWGLLYYRQRKDLRNNRGMPPEFPINLNLVESIKKHCKEEKRIPLTSEALEVCRAAGITPVRHAVLGSDETPEDLKMIFPVAVKLLSRNASHKSDVGGVKLNIDSSGGIIDAIAEIKNSVKAMAMPAAVDGFMIQEMAPRGEEFFVGARQDPVFGPIVIAGFGGIFIEVLKDRAIRLAPITEAEAEDMLRQLRMFPLLAGVRGKPALDIEALVGMLCRVSHLITTVPTISEMDLNPIIVHPRGMGLSVVDARVFFF
ncbi:MAG: acetate--CoA ligase family protein [Spirochaetes bacterium]|nr:acetate--CoA ligase family protein [Spirochaetota bacterium]